VRASIRGDNAMAFLLKVSLPRQKDDNPASVMPSVPARAAVFVDAAYP
jgi:hypothetical protein